MFGDILVLVPSMSVVYTFRRLRLLAPDRSGVLLKHSVRPNHRTLRQRWPRTCLPKPGKTVGDFASTPVGGSSPWNFCKSPWKVLKPSIAGFKWESLYGKISLYCCTPKAFFIQRKMILLRRGDILILVEIGFHSLLSWEGSSIQRL